MRDPGGTVLDASRRLAIGAPWYAAGSGSYGGAAILRSVVDARAMRYLMLNAPAAAVDEIAEIVPGSRAPTVLPLREEGMVAVHVLVPAADVWHLLPRLEQAGASSILLVPVERLLA